MGTINDTGKSVYRDYRTDGVPASGLNDPIKFDIRALFGVIDAVASSLATISSVGKAYATKSAMDADLVPIAGVIGAVYNDGTPANNGFYVKAGASGTGSWTATGIGLPSTFAADLAGTISTANQALAFARPANAKTRLFKVDTTSFPVFERILALSVDPSITLPARLVVVRFARDSVSGGRFGFLISGFDGTTYTPLIGVAGGGSNISPTGFIGEMQIDLKAASGTAFAGVADGQKIGSARFDFGGGEDFGNIATTYTAAQAEIIVDKLQLTAAQKAALTPVIDQEIVAYSNRSPAFIASVVDGFTLSAVRGAVILGGQIDHQYGISILERFTNRASVMIRDFTAGYDVAYGAVVATPVPYGSLQPYLLCDSANSGLATFSGIMVFLDIDWSVFSNGSPITFGSYALGGIKSTAIVTPEEMESFIVTPRADKRIYVAPGNGTLQTAINMILSADHSPTDPNLSISQVSNPRRVPVFELAKGDYGCRNTGFPQFIHIRGKGMGLTRIINTGTPGSGNAGHITQSPYSIWIEDVEFVTDVATASYAMHIDEAGARNKADGNVGGNGVQHFRTFQRFDRCKYRAGPTALSAALGIGIASGQHSFFNECIFIGENPSTPTTDLRPALASHNTAAAALPSVIVLNNCHHHDAVKKGIGATWNLQSLGSGQRDRCIINGGSAFICIIAGGYISNGVIADLAEDVVLETSVSGTPNYPVAYADGRAIVLGFPIAATVSESTALLVKGLYSWGFGKASIAEGAAYVTTSLGARLGVNPTYSLTVNGLTWTANSTHDYTSDSNATIVAAINAVLGAGVVTIERADWYYYPDIGHKMSVLNGSGGDWTRAHKGYAVRFVPGSNTQVVLADGDDPVDGWILRPGANAAYVEIIRAERVGSVYVKGATVDGEFRIVSGVPTFTGVTTANRKGRVIGAAGQTCGVVQLY